MKRLLSWLFLSSLFLWSPFLVYPSDFLAELTDIRSSNIANEKDLLRLNSYLNEENILLRSAVKEKLLFSDYNTLSSLASASENKQGLKEITSLMHTLLDKKDKSALFLRQEDILIGNYSPLSLTEPSPGPIRLDQADFRKEHIYFERLNLKPQRLPPTLMQIDDTHWLDRRQIKPTLAVPDDLPFPEDFFANGTQKKQSWQYHLPDDNRFTYVFDSRQWIKSYQEPLQSVIFHKGISFLRNEHRIFALDAQGSEQLWSFNPDETEGYELYHTFQHPHHNWQGYEFYLKDNVIFTELNGTFTAIDVEDPLTPTLLWKQPLGEFTLCSSPFASGETVIAGVMNSRQEIWICGFNRSNGSLRWSTYIGISSFSSPISFLETSNDEKAFIATNHGFICCVHRDTGSISWIKKYTPRRYDLFQYWKEGSYGQAIVEYDTQFLYAGERQLYYKPRESPYLYILDALDGTTKSDFFIDPDRYYTLGASRSQIFLLEKPQGQESIYQFLAVDAFTGKIMLTQPIPGRNFRGLLSTKRDFSLELAFKIDSTIYAFNSTKMAIRKMPSPFSNESWLVHQERSSSLGAIDKNTLHLVNISSPIKDESDNVINEYKTQKERLFDTLDNASGLLQYPKIEKRIFSLLNTYPVFIEEFLDFFISHQAIFSEKFSKHFFKKLAKNYGNKFITYHDVSMRVSEFLYKTNKIKTPVTQKSPPSSSKHSQPAKPSPAPVHIKMKGEFLIPVPVELTRGQKDTLHYLLFFNFDQLLCVDEKTKNIVWERKMFYRFRGNPSARHAYLYKNILVIQTPMDILGIDIDTGRLIWCLTDHIHPYPVMNTVIHTHLVHDSLVVVSNKKLYVLDPQTGYGKEPIVLPYDFFTVKITDRYAAGLSEDLDEIFVFDIEHSLKETVPLSSLGSGDILDTSVLSTSGHPRKKMHSRRQFHPQLFILNDYVGLYLNPTIYLIDPHTARLITSKNIDTSTATIETYKDTLIAISPFFKVSGYRLERTTLRKNWELVLSPEKDFSRLEKQQQDNYRAVFGSLKSPKEASYFIDKNILFFPTEQDQKYAIAGVDIEKGEKIWNTEIEGLSGYFYFLSNAIEIDDSLTFIFVTIDEMTTLMTLIDPRLIEIDRNTGKLIMHKKLTRSGRSNAQAIMVTQSDSYLAYRESVNQLVIEKKKNP